MRIGGMLLLAVLIASGAVAQERAPMTDGQEAALYAVPILATFGTALSLGQIDEEIAPFVFAGLPLLAVGTTCLMGDALEVPGSCTGAFWGGVRGITPAVVLVGAGLAYDQVFTNRMDYSTGFYIALVGALAYIVVPPFTAIAGYRQGAPVVAEPVHLVVPEGEAVGLRVRLGL